MRRTILLLTAVAAALAAQEITKEDRQKQLIKEMVDTGVKSAASTPPVTEPFSSALADSGQILDRIAGTIGDAERYRKLEQVLEARLDRQVGAAPNANGTTSLAMK